MFQRLLGVFLFFATQANALPSTSSWKTDNFCDLQTNFLPIVIAITYLGWEEIVKSESDPSEPEDVKKAKKLKICSWAESQEKASAAITATFLQLIDPNRRKDAQNIKSSFCEYFKIKDLQNFFTPNERFSIALRCGDLYTLTETSEE